MKVGGPKPVITTLPAPAPVEATKVAAPRPDTFSSSPLQEIALCGSITDPKVQISGMAWHGDQLVLLPQWAKTLYVLDKADLSAAVEGRSGPLTPRELGVGPPGFETRFPGFEGFEAIAIKGDRAWLLAEAKVGDDMLGYLVPAQLGPQGLTLELDRIKTLPVADQVKNMGYEALLLSGEQLLVLPEAGFGPHVAHAFDLELNALGSVGMPQVDYRLTDSTPADSDGRFWVANYNHPGDAGMPAAPRVEQLDPMRLTAQGVQRDGAPLGITPDLTQPGRNWEAMAKLDDQGFLVMTDEFPRAIFGFVATRG